MARLHAAVAAHGDKVAVVPASRLADLRQDIESLKRDNVLNDFQRHVVDSIYTLDAPDVGLAPRSLIVVATPSSAATLTLTWQGKGVPVTIPAGYVGNVSVPPRIEQYLNEALAPDGYQVRLAGRLPKKLLAARSGLGRYGRNNLCYVEGMGSCLNLVSFVSDLPCAEGDWREIAQMEACRGCEACLHACPTGAIMEERFLIDNQRCLTYFNEAGPEYDFPDWIPPSAHHAAYGRSRCLAACPENRAHIGRIGAQVALSEEETDVLLQGLALERLPEGLRRKVNDLDMAGYLGALPRNLRALGMVSSAGERHGGER